MKIPLLVAGFCLGLAATTAQAQQETLKIGALVTLSGAGAAWGQGMLHAAELAADDANAQGGLEVAGKRYKVEVIPYDDKYQANEAVTVANRLVFEDKVKYIIGPVGSAPVLAIQPITEKNGVIVMTLGFTPKALGADKPYTFRPNVTTAEVSQPQIDWAVKSLGIKKVGALFPNDETGQAIAKDLRRPTARPGRSSRPRSSSSATASTSCRCSPGSWPGASTPSSSTATRRRPRACW